MQTIALNLIPKGPNPICYCSQYDSGRIIRIELYEGNNPYTIKSGDTFTLNLRKPDNTIVTASVTATQGNKYVDLVTTEQICAVVGYNLCDLTITNGSAVIGTLNFIMAIERDVLADGIPSESVIEDLDALVAEAVTDFCYTKTETDELLSAKADADSVYTKAETDNLLNDKADKSETYTKSETDNLLNYKADADTVYTKSETDNLLDAKADADRVYTKSDTDTLLSAKADADTVYTKTETDNLLSAKADSSDVYIKSETDNLLNDKADKSTTYTKTETDNLLSSKADTSDLPTKTSDLTNDSGFTTLDDNTTVNNKAWSSEKTASEIINILPTGTASGSVANFNTSLALPLKAAKFDIIASGGGGTPSEPIHINGVSAVNVYQLGGNFFDKNTLAETGKLINGAGNEVSYADWCISDFIPVVEGASYYFYGITTHPNTNQDNFELFDTNKNKVGFANVKTYEQPYLIPSGVKYIKCCVKNPDLDTAQFGVSKNTSYVPYSPTINTVTIALGGMYYGGYVTQDKDGHRQIVLTSKGKKIKDIEGWSFFASYNYFETVLNEMKGGSTSEVLSGLMCECYTPRSAAQAGSGNIDLSIAGYSYQNTTNNIRIKDNAYNNNKDAWLAAVGDYLVVYPLAEPIVIDLTDGEPIVAFVGANNIFADSGNSEVVYRKSIDDAIAELQALILNN